MNISHHIPTAQDVAKSSNNVYEPVKAPDVNSDQAYSDDDDEQTTEEKKEAYNKRKREIEQTELNNSDDQAYTESDEDANYRSGDDFDFTSQDSEERNKAFYGDDYTLLSNVKESDQMSMTMQQRQMSENLNKIALLKRDIDQIKYKV